MPCIPYRIDEIPYSRVKAVSSIGNEVLFTFSVELGKHRQNAVLRHSLVDKGIIAAYNEALIRYSDYTVKDILSRTVLIKNYVVFFRLGIAPFKYRNVPVGFEKRTHTRALGNRGVDTALTEFILDGALDKSVKKLYNEINS